MRIDSEFRTLIPPLSKEEFEQLEQNCLKDGIRDSLIVWDDNGEFVLIDGHNRYEIAQKHNLPYSHRRMEFPNREAVIEWIIRNQFGRRNLSAYDRSILALKLKPVIAEKAKEKQSEAGGAVRQKSDKAAIDTKKELAKVAGVSHDTIHKVETIEKKAPEEVKEAIRRGDMSINKVYTDIIASEHETIRQEEERKLREAKKRHEDFVDQKNEGVVSLDAARQDKEDGKVLFEELQTYFMEAANKVFYLGGKQQSGELQNLLENGDHWELRDLYQKCERMHSTTIRLMRAIGEAIEKQS